MIDLVDVMIKAHKTNPSWSKDSLSMIIEQDIILYFNWDRDCGERWASILMNNRFIGYISCFIPLCFCKVDSSKEIENLFRGDIVIIEDDDFDEKKWFINEEKLNKNLSILSWIIQEDVLDIKKFSINDLWYATI